MAEYCRVRDYSHLMDAIAHSRQQCLAYAAQRIIVENCTLTEEEAATMLYDTMKRIYGVYARLQQKPAF